jgi:hypothetical protein
MSSVVEFIPIAGLIKVRITAVGVGHNATLMNIFNFKAATTPDAATVASVAGLVQAWIVNTYSGQVSEFVRFTSVEAWSGEEQFGPAHTIAMNELGSAISSSTIVDYAWAPLIGLKTGTRGRFATGKWYAFTPVLETVQIGNYDPTHMAGLVAAAAQLLSHASDNNTPWVVASETRLNTYQINEFKPSARLTEQTRRRPDFGR